MAVFPVAVVVVVLRLIVILILTIGFRRVRAASPFPPPPLPHALRWLCCCDGHMTSPFSMSPVALCSPFPYPLTHFFLSLPSLLPPCYTASVNTAIYFMHNSLCALQMVSYVFMMVTRQLLSSFPSPSPSPFPFAALPPSLSPCLSLCGL